MTTKPNPTSTSVDKFMHRLRNNEEFIQVVTHIQTLYPREAAYKELSRSLGHKLEAALELNGINRLYSHQAESIDRIRDKHNVVIATSTASGKSLCYNIPVVEELLRNPNSRALYLFPTKALSQDQKMSLNDFLAQADIAGIRCDTYDRDTPRKDRANIRSNTHIVISNVDMVQASTLPLYSYWRKFLSNLRYVVLDEAHYYRGVLGSHVAMIMRRLRRICRLLGSDPQFVLCSATIANALEHAHNLTGTSFELVDIDGSPSGPRDFVLWNADSDSNGQDERLGINHEAGRLTAEMIRGGLKTLVFARSRPATERIVQYAQDSLHRLTQFDPGAYRDVDNAIQPYRAGYLPEYRRQVERDLKSGRLQAVVSTNAMELGIDVGALDATVMAGYPGTIASSWQQAGRSGRNTKRSLTIMMLRDRAVDQFFCRNPRAFFEAPNESARISLENESIVRAHLSCAAHEIPLSRADFDIFGEVILKDIAGKMVRERRLIACPDKTRRLPPGTENPARSINIRSIGSTEQFMLIDSGAGEVLEKVDGDTALNEFYEGAVYYHASRPYKVHEFDNNQRIANCRPHTESYYTQSTRDTDVTITNVDREGTLGQLTLWYGDVRVAAQVTGYHKKQLYRTKKDSKDWYPVENMPVNQFNTKAAWFIMPNLQNKPADVTDMEIMHAIEHIGREALAMLAMCDPGDIQGVVFQDHPQVQGTCVFFFENHEGGVGLVELAAVQPRAFNERMRDMVAMCRCRVGCPACVESAVCMDTDIKPSKAGAMEYFRFVLRQ